MQNSGSGYVDIATTGPSSLLTVEDPVSDTSGFVEFRADGVTETTDPVTLGTGIIVAPQLLLSGTGTFTLNQANELAYPAAPGILAADVTGPLMLVNSTALDVATVYGTSGIDTDGEPPLTSTTDSGLLNVQQAIDTSGVIGGALTIGSNVTVAVPCCLGRALS